MYDAGISAIEDSGIDPSDTTIKIILTTYGERMWLSIILPGGYSYDPGDGHRHNGDLTIADINTVLNAGLEAAEHDKKNFKEWRERGMVPGELAGWISSDVRGAWGFKAELSAAPDVPSSQGSINIAVAPSDVSGGSGCASTAAVAPPETDRAPVEHREG